MYIMGLIENPRVGGVGVEVESSSYVFVSVKRFDDTRACLLGSFFLDFGNVRCLIMGAIWNVVKRTGLLPSLGLQSYGLRGIVKGLPASVSKGL